MKVVIDGYVDLVIPEGDETLRELLIELKEWIKKNKRVIVQVKLEGKIFSEENKEIVLGRKVRELKILELFTASLWQRAIDSLKQIEEKLPGIALGMEKVGFLIQKGSYRDAFLLLNKSIEAWDRVNEALQQIETLFTLDYTHILLEGKTMADKMDEFKELLEEANRAMEEDDLLTLADILEYELAPRIREEKMVADKIIKMIIQQVN